MPRTITEMQDTVAGVPQSIAEMKRKPNAASAANTAILQRVNATAEDHETPVFHLRRVAPKAANRAQPDPSSPPEPSAPLQTSQARVRCSSRRGAHPRHRFTISCYPEPQKCQTNPLSLPSSTAGATAPRPTATPSHSHANPTTTSSSATYPNTLLRASDHFVGLPDGQMGNSEVGHLNLGAGRIVRMDIPRIDEAIADRSFFVDPVLTAAVTLAAQKEPRPPSLRPRLRRRSPLAAAPPLRAPAPRRAAQAHPCLRPCLHGRP